MTDTHTVTVTTVFEYQGGGNVHTDIGIADTASVQEVLHIAGSLLEMVKAQYKSDSPDHNMLKASICSLEMALGYKIGEYPHKALPADA